MGTSIKTVNILFLVAYDLSVLFLVSAVVNTVVLLFIVLFFNEKPTLPPSLAQLRATEESIDHDFLGSVKKLCMNVNYLLLLFTYGRVVSQPVIMTHERIYTTF